MADELRNESACRLANELAACECAAGGKLCDLCKAKGDALFAMYFRPVWTPSLKTEEANEKYQDLMLESEAELQAWGEFIGKPASWREYAEGESRPNFKEWLLGSRSKKSNALADLRHFNGSGGRARAPRRRQTQWIIAAAPRTGQKSNDRLLSGELLKFIRPAAPLSIEGIPGRSIIRGHFQQKGPRGRLLATLTSGDTSTWAIVHFYPFASGVHKAKRLTVSVREAPDFCELSLFVAGMLVADRLVTRCYTGLEQFSPVRNPAQSAGIGPGNSSVLDDELGPEDRAAANELLQAVKERVEARGASGQKEWQLLELLNRGYSQADAARELEENADWVSYHAAKAIERAASLFPEIPIHSPGIALAPAFEATPGVASVDVMRIPDISRDLLPESFYAVTH